MQLVLLMQFFFTDTIPYVEKSPMLKSILNCTVSKFLWYKRTEYINRLLKYFNNRQHESLDWLNCTFFFFFLSMSNDSTCILVELAEFNSLESYAYIFACMHLYTIYTRDKVLRAILYVFVCIHSVYEYVSLCVDGATYTTFRSVNHWHINSRLSSIWFRHPLFHWDFSVERALLTSIYTVEWSKKMKSDLSHYFK